MHGGIGRTPDTEVEEVVCFPDHPLVKLLRVTRDLESLHISPPLAGPRPRSTAIRDTVDLAGGLQTPGLFKTHCNLCLVDMQESTYS